MKASNSQHECIQNLATIMRCRIPKSTASCKYRAVHGSRQRRTRGGDQFFGRGNVQVGHAARSSITGKIPGSEQRIFSEAQSREMWTGQTLLPIGGGDSPHAALRPKFAAYALGWGVQDYHGRKLVSHSGGVSGFVTRVMLVPEENLGVLVFTNAEEGAAFESILFHILDSYFGVPPTADWIAAFMSRQRTSKKRKRRRMMAASEGKGRAADSKPFAAPRKIRRNLQRRAWYGPITIKQESSGLVFRMEHTPKAVAELQHWQYGEHIQSCYWRDRTIEDAFCDVHVESGWQHRSLYDGRGFCLWRISASTIRICGSPPSGNTRTDTYSTDWLNAPRTIRNSPDIP